MCGCNTYCSYAHLGGTLKQNCLERMILIRNVIAASSDTWYNYTELTWRNMNSLVPSKESDHQPHTVHIRKQRAVSLLAQYCCNCLFLFTDQWLQSKPKHTTHHPPPQPSPIISYLILSYCCNKFYLKWLKLLYLYDTLGIFVPLSIMSVQI